MLVLPYRFFARAGFSAAGFSATTVAALVALPGFAERDCRRRTTRG
jgi:hypothetical protein